MMLLIRMPFFCLGSPSLFLSGHLLVMLKDLAQVFPSGAFLAFPFPLHFSHQTRVHVFEKYFHSHPALHGAGCVSVLHQTWVP